MSLFRATGRLAAGSTTSTRAVAGYEERRRTLRPALSAAGTLACDACDAPVALGPDPIAPSDELTCPFCRRRAPAWAFLSLASPARPARVVVRAIVP